MLISFPNEFLSLIERTPDSPPLIPPRGRYRYSAGIHDDMPHDYLTLIDKVAKFDSQSRSHLAGDPDGARGRENMVS